MLTVDLFETCSYSFIIINFIFLQNSYVVFCNSGTSKDSIHVQIKYSSIAFRFLRTEPNLDSYAVHQSLVLIY